MIGLSQNALCIQDADKGDYVVENSLQPACIFRKGNFSFLPLGYIAERYGETVIQFDGSYADPKVQALMRVVNVALNGIPVSTAET